MKSRLDHVMKSMASTIVMKSRLDRVMKSRLDRVL